MSINEPNTKETEENIEITLIWFSDRNQELTYPCLENGSWRYGKRVTMPRA